MVSEALIGQPWVMILYYVPHKLLMNICNVYTFTHIRLSQVHHIGCYACMLHILAEVIFKHVFATLESPTKKQRD